MCASVQSVFSLYVQTVLYLGLFITFVVVVVFDCCVGTVP